ncbi:MAG: dimethyl sulfoxide reductase anchor subunit [Firmicutes bacterium]|nr:dimethyl sulfoxide reductase anchor subunit [Bacillota bacterium]
MRPAPQLLVLTVGQGIAGGLAVSLAALWSMGVLSHADAVWLVLLALLTAAMGGVASFFHMHHMAAARYILRRLKTSWLSREALTTGLFGGALAVAAAWSLFGHTAGWPYLWWLWLTAAAGLLAMWVTAMLYATIPAVLSWHTPVTVISLLSLGLLSGASWVGLVLPLGDHRYRVFAVAVMVFTVFVLGIKALHWRHFAEAHGRLRAETGTGLPFAPYRLQDTGTTKPPYRMQPQVWPAIPVRVRNLFYGLIVLFVGAGSLGCLLLARLTGVELFSVILPGMVSVGVVLERWLFFADATHSSRVFFVDEPRQPSRLKLSPRARVPAK